MPSNRFLCLPVLALSVVLFAGDLRAEDPFESAARIYSQKKYKEAIAAFEKVPTDHPKYATAQRFIGYNIYVRELHEPKKGLPYLKAALKAAPWDGSVLIDYARGQLAADRPLSKRKRKKKLDDDFDFVMGTIKGLGSWDEKLSRADLEKDLDVLEFLLEEGYSYLKWKGIEYQSVLDGIRSRLIGHNQRGTFALHVAKLLTLFGDGHTRVINPMNRFVPPGYSPFLTGMDKDRVFLFEGDRTRFVDPEKPYVTQIDGEPIEKWLEAAGRLVPDGSPQWQRREAVRNLRYIGYLRAELKLPQRAIIDYQVVSTDGKNSRMLSAPIAQDRAIYGGWPRGDSRILEKNLGYLRIPTMSHKTRFLAKLDENMTRFKDTQGLIIDVRGNSGGSRDALRTLLPYFLEPDGGMRICSIAARRNTPRKNGHPEGYLQARYMYPETSTTWADAEREQIRKFLKKFKPEWKLPKREFGAWHVLGISPKTNPSAYHYDKPVVILMNEDCFSATDIFLGAFKGLSNVKLLGTASGGGSGYTERYVLPNSRVQFKASRMASFLPDGSMYDGNGIKPDVFMRAIPTDQFENGTDTLLDAAIKRLTH